MVLMALTMICLFVFRKAKHFTGMYIIIGVFSGLTGAYDTMRGCIVLGVISIIISIILGENDDTDDEKRP